MAGVPRKLFVYGSLLSAVSLPAHGMLHPGASFISRGSVGGRLYDAGDYPALVPGGSGGERVQGELYALDPGDAAPLLTRLDRFEGYLPEEPEVSLFLRIQLEVLLASGESTQAWTYVYNRSVERLPRIPSGDYAAYVHAQTRGRRGDPPAESEPSPKGEP